MTQYIGLMNAVMHRIEPKDCKFLVLYDVDNHNDGTPEALRYIYDKFETSYIIYKTKHGYHAVGLTPLSANMWGQYFQVLHNYFHEFYAGQVLRFSPKQGETRELFCHSFKFPYIRLLAERYASILSIPKNELPTFGDKCEYGINIQRYRSLND